MGREDLKGSATGFAAATNRPSAQQSLGICVLVDGGQSFDEVSLPNLTVTEPNPAARLDFWRFQSEQVAAYDRMQCEIIRRHSPGRWITHNFMGFFNEFDHWPLGEDLDFASWDSYPIGSSSTFRSKNPSACAGRILRTRTSRRFIMTFIAASVGGGSG